MRFLVACLLLVLLFPCIGIGQGYERLARIKVAGKVMMYVGKKN